MTGAISSLPAKPTCPPQEAVRVRSPAPEEQWAKIAAAGDALPTQRPEWAGWVRSGGWQDRSRLYELADGRRLILPMVGRGWGPTAVLASWPYGWGYGGLIASDGRVTESDVTTVLHDLAGSGALRISLSPSPFQDAWEAAAPVARSRTDYLIHALDLTPGREAIWRAYSGNVRRSVRRAERAGLEVRRDDTGALLPVFADLYRVSVRRWATASGRPTSLALLQHHISEPPRRLAALAAALGPSLVVWGAFLDGQPVAAIVVVRGCSHVLYWRGAMDRDLAARTHANALLHDRAIEEAIAEGACCYSFGESDPASGLAGYKAKFGAQPRYWSTYHLERLPITATIRTLKTGYGSVAQLPGRLQTRRRSRAR
jgi:hypothetical protein